MKPDDSILKKGLKKGDREVFKILFLQYSNGLIAYANFMIRDHEEARELVQDLFLELWEKRDQLTIHGSVKSYLFGSLYNRSLNWLRAKKIRETYAENPSAVYKWFGVDPDLNQSDPLQLAIIETAIRLLPDQCREVFTRSVILGENSNEISAAMGLKGKTIENHLGRARKILRKKLNKFR